METEDFWVKNRTSELKKARFKEADRRSLAMAVDHQEVFFPHQEPREEASLTEEAAAASEGSRTFSPWRLQNPLPAKAGFRVRGGLSLPFMHALFRVRNRPLLEWPPRVTGTGGRQRLADVWVPPSAPIDGCDDRRTILWGFFNK